MLFADGALGLVLMAVWVFCLIEVITTPEGECRHLEKIWWLLIVLFFLDVGAILWLVAGRPRRSPLIGSARGRQGESAFPEYDRPGRFVASQDAADDDFLRRCRERAELQRQAYRQQRRAEGESTGGQSDG